MSVRRNANATRPRSLMKNGSAGALAMGLLFATHGTAIAQAYDGNPVVVQGTVDIDRTNPGQDIFTVDTLSATINWTPNDTGTGGGEIDFLPAGFQALYQNNPALISDFVLLNRILPNDPSRPIALNGNIISQLQGAAGAVPGGTVWFYSPGGVIVGSTATLDIGNLLLTTSDPGTGPLVSSSFSGSQAVSGTSVEIRNGAMINALTEGSYVAAMAPAITQAGTVNVNGQAAYVAAERAILQFSPDGLSRVQVFEGTDGLAGVPIRHLGTTTGPASSGTGDNHRIYMVAIPKNDAITMVIGAGSELGFDIASAADVDGNAVILSAGYGISNGQIENFTASTIESNIAITNANFTSALDGRALSAINVDSNIASMNFASDIDLQAGDWIDFLVDGANNSLTVGGILNLNADRFSLVPGATVVGGDINIRALNGGTLSVVGDARISARGTGGFAASGVGGNGTGGTLLIQADNGSTMNFSSNVFGDVIGSSGGGSMPGGIGRGGNARVLVTGGNSTISVDGSLGLRGDATGRDGGDAIGGYGEVSGSGGTGNQITVTGILDLFFPGRGFLGTPGSGIDGGQITGGQIVVRADSGTTITAGRTGMGVTANGVNSFQGAAGGDAQGGSIIIEANGLDAILNLGDAPLNAGAVGGNSSGGIGGSATGGSINLLATNGGTVRLGGLNAIPNANATGGDGDLSGGNATGGIFDFSADGGTIFFTSTFGVFVNATGGNASAGTGGFGQAGTFRLRTLPGGSIDGAAIEVNADGFGGDGSGSGGTAGFGAGGDIEIIADGGLFRSALTLSSGGIGGDGSNDANGGDGTGGHILIAASNSGNMDQQIIEARANARGGAALSGIGGSGLGTGGVIDLSADGGSVLVRSRLILEANAGIFLGTDSGGGDVQGGAVSIIADNGGSFVARTDARLEAIGNADFNSTGVGETGRGGTILVESDSGANIDFGRNLSLDVSGIGGGSFNLAAGDGFGGNATINAISGNISVADDALIIATGNGRSGQISSGVADGGNGTGGVARLSATGAGGLIDIGRAELITTGFAGNVSVAGTRGGVGIGGVSEILALGGDIIFGDNSALTSNGSGGGSFFGLDGSAGNDAIGGRSSIIAREGTVTAGTLRMESNGFGGSGSSGQNGGNGFGGIVQVLAQNGAIASTITINDLTMQARGAGGDGGNGIDGAVGGDGGDGGNSNGGSIELLASSGNGNLVIGDADLSATGPASRGGNGGMGTAGAGGNGGNGGIGVGGSIVVGVQTGASNPNNSGSASFTSITSVDQSFSNNRTGGNGGAGTTVDGNGGNGGDIIGSIVQIQAENGAVTVGDIQVQSQGAGGRGGEGEQAGDGGDGTGGTVRLIATGGNGSIDVSSISNFRASGSGGNAVGVGGTAGDGVGGLAEVIVDGGAINFADNGPMRINADGITGQGLNGGIFGEGIGGVARLTAREGIVSGTQITLSANGSNFVGSGGAASGGLVEVIAHSGATSGTIAFDNLNIQATAAAGSGFDGADGVTGEDGGEGGDATGGTVRILAGAGNGMININDVDVSAFGRAGAGGDGGMGSSGNGGRGGDSGMARGGQIIFGTNSDGTILANDGQINIGTRLRLRAYDIGSSGGTGGAGTTQGVGGSGGDGFGGDVRFAMHGGTANIGLLQIEAAGRVGVGGAGSTNGSDGNYTFGRPTEISILRHNGSGAGATANIDQLSVAGFPGTSSGSVNVDVDGSIANFDRFNIFGRRTGLFSPDETANIAITDGSINLGGEISSVSVAGNINIMLNNGTISSGNGVGFSAGADLSISGMGRIDGNGTTAFDSNGDFSSNVALSADLTRISSRGSINLNAGIDSRRIDLSGADIVVAPNITVGNQQTESITLQSNSPNRAILGGNGTGTGFILDDSELSQLQGNTISFFANNNGVEVRDINLLGFGAGANANLTSDTGSFVINTPGTIRVNGQVNFTDMADGNIVSLIARGNNTIEIAADTGGISLMGNSPGGILSLEADRIHIAEASLLDQLATDPNFSGRDDALAMPTANTRPEGIINARHIDFMAQDSLFIQNSGTDTLFGGFSALSGEVVITPTGTAGTDLDMVIYGRLENPDGTFISNENVRDALFDPLPGAGFTANSGVSGCALTAGACDPIVVPPPDPSPDPDPHPEDPVDIAPDIRDRVENEAQNGESDPAEEESDEADEESTTTDEEEEAIEKATSRSPIVRPVTIVDTRPLDSDAVIDEPVTGGGNPGLIGVPGAGSDIETDLQP